MTETMKPLNVEIPSKLHTDIKVAAAEDEIPLKEWVAAALQYKLDERKKGSKKDPFAEISSTEDLDALEGMLSPKKSSSSKPRSSHAERGTKRH